MPNVYKKLRFDKDKPHPCEQCNAYWYCQYSDKERMGMKCFQKLMEEMNQKDGTKIVMFY
jgi:hypothetical protein